MKRNNNALLIILMSIAGLIIVFSKEAAQGAKNGLVLAQNTIIPSLLPLLIIFFLIMKTGAKDSLARLLGFICPYVFNLPQVTLPAVFFGLIGGYPTGALMTKELFDAGEIDNEQAKRMLRFNFCGGCGFIITAVGLSTLKSQKIGIILLLSNVFACIILGVFLSFSQKRTYSKFYSFTQIKNFGDCLIDSVNAGLKSVLNITAFIVLFSAVSNIIKIPKEITPIIEITSGICAQNNIPIAQICAYLSFGGICIHLQLLGIIKQINMKYIDFLTFRIISSFLSYVISKIMFYFFPVDKSVFSNNAPTIAEFSSVNILLSILLILGCFIIVLDIHSKKKIC